MSLFTEPQLREELKTASLVRLEVFDAKGELSIRYEMRGGGIKALDLMFDLCHCDEAPPKPLPEPPA